MQDNRPTMHLSINGIQFISVLVDNSIETTLERAEREINNLGLNFDQAQFDSLVSLITSIGLTAFRNSSLRTLLIGQLSTPAEIRRAFHWWIRGEDDTGRVGIQTALIARRRAEADLFLTNSLERAGGD